MQHFLLIGHSFNQFGPKAPQSLDLAVLAGPGTRGCWYRSRYPSNLAPGQPLTSDHYAEHPPTRVISKEKKKAMSIC